MCRKQCDIDHDIDHEEVNEEKHQCRNGHQLQGFGGSKDFNDNYALLKSCDEINENDNVKVNGKDEKWSLF